MKINTINIIGKSLLSFVNVALSIIVLALMSSDFLSIFIDSGRDINTSEFDDFFSSTVLHPGTGIIYISFVCGLVIYQPKLKNQRFSYMIQGLFLALSSLIIMKTVSLFNFFT